MQAVVAALNAVNHGLLQGSGKCTARDFLERALAVAEVKTDDERRAEALSGVAQVLAQSGGQEEALSVLRHAFAAARVAGRQSLFSVLRSGASTLAIMDRGESLWEIRKAVEEVNGWWPSSP
jgi:hypothetical protein